MEGCRQSDCVLLGGETAEMPGFYSPGEYDLAGFAVGSVKQDKVIDGSRIKVGWQWGGGKCEKHRVWAAGLGSVGGCVCGFALVACAGVEASADFLWHLLLRHLQAGDAILGLKSSGVHSNGFSLVRKVLEVSDPTLPLLDCTLGASHSVCITCLPAHVVPTPPSLCKRAHSSFPPPPQPIAAGVWHLAARHCTLERRELWADPADPHRALRSRLHEAGGRS